MKTVRELAKEIGVTDQTIRNEIKRQNISVARDKNSFVVTDADADTILKTLKERNELRTSAKRKTNKRDNSDLVFALRQEIADKDKQIDFLQNEVTLLHEQNTSLSNAVTELTNSIKSIQALQTGMKMLEQHNDRKWWQFWKH